MTETILLSRTDGIAEVRLCRPAAGNPVDAVLLRELADAAAALGADASVRVVLLTAEGERFASSAAPAQPGSALGLYAAPGEALRALELMPQPVIAVIEGDASGAGLELALACDARIASEDVTFAMPGVASGEIPALGGTQRLPRLAGRGVAAQMLLLGETLDAAAALRCGLVSAVVPRAGVRAHAVRLAASMAARGPLALRYAKEAMLRGLDMPLEQALRYETDLTVILQTTEERAEGVRAFLEKREPRFGNR